MFDKIDLIVLGLGLAIWGLAWLRSKVSMFRRKDDISIPGTSFDEKFAYSEVAFDSDEYWDIIALRTQKSVDETTHLRDAYRHEKDYLHIAGYFDEFLLTSAAMLVPENTKCKIEHIVVEKSPFEIEEGCRLLQYCEEIATAKGFIELYCDAPAHSIPFFLKANFKIHGAPYEENGIQHVRLCKNLIHPQWTSSSSIHTTNA